MKICKCGKLVTYKRSAKCKECHSQYNKKHYQNNKQKYLDKSRKNNARYLFAVREYILDHLNSHPCVDCGFSDIRALDFDHVRGEKLFNIAEAGTKITNLRAVKAEIAKCEVRCKNCHSIVTNERGNLWRQQAISNNWDAHQRKE